MPRKKYLVMLGLVVVLALVCWAFNNKATFNLKHSLGLAAVGSTYNCQFTSDNNVANSSGMIYVDGDRVRGDFQNSMKALNTDMETHLIKANGYAYLWSPLTNTGYKTASAATNIDPQSLHDCQPWDVDQTAFDLPDNVTFADAPATN